MNDKIHNYFFNFPKEMPWKENKMNTKEKKQKLIKELRDNINLDTSSVYQDCPWTFVTFITMHNGIHYETFGFSKVCYPDKWDEDYGIELATTKALYKLAKEILTKEK